MDVKLMLVAVPCILAMAVVAVAVVAADWVASRIGMV